MTIEGQPSVSEPPDPIPPEAEKVVDETSEQRGVKIEKVPAAIDGEITPETADRSAQLRDMLLDKQDFPASFIESAKKQIGFARGEEFKDFIGTGISAERQEYIQDGMEAVFSRIGDNQISLSEIQLTVDQAVKVKEPDALFAIKAAAARILKDKQPGGKETWRPLSPQDKIDIRAAQMMLQMAEIGAIKVGLETLTQEKAEKFGRQFTRYAQSVDIPDAFRARLNEATRLITDRFPEARGAIQRVAQPRIEKQPRKTAEQLPKSPEKEEGLIAPLAEAAPEAKAAAVPPPLPSETTGPPPLPQEIIRQAQWEAMQKVAVEAAAKGPDELYDLTEKQRAEWQHALFNLRSPKQGWEQQARARLEEAAVYGRDHGQDPNLNEGITKLLAGSNFFQELPSGEKKWMREYLANIDDEFIETSEAQRRAEDRIIGDGRAVGRLFGRIISGGFWKPFEKKIAERRQIVARELLQFANRQSGETEASAFARQIGYTLQGKVLEGWLGDRGIVEANSKEQAAQAAEAQRQADERLAAELEKTRQGQAAAEAALAEKQAAEFAKVSDVYLQRSDKLIEILDEQKELIDDNKFASRALKQFSEKLKVDLAISQSQLAGDRPEIEEQRKRILKSIKIQESNLGSVLRNYKDAQRRQRLHDINQELRKQTRQLLELYRGEPPRGGAVGEAPPAQAA